MHLVFSIRPDRTIHDADVLAPLFFLDLHWPREPPGNVQVVFLPLLMFNNAKLLYK